MSIPSNNPQDPSIKSKVSIPLKIYEANVASSALGASKVTKETTTPSSSQGFSSGAAKDVWRDLGKVNFNPLSSVSDNPTVRASVNGLEDVISTLEVAIDVLKVAGKIINAFQTDANNLFLAIDYAVQAIIETLKELAVSLSSTGIYVLPLLPETSPFDPSTPAGGGFKEVKAKINHALTNKQDPNRPVFFDGDYLGALIFLTSAGTNAGNVIRDLSILVRFLQGDEGSVKVSPVTALTSTPGLFYETEGISEGFTDSITDILSAAVGIKLPGIKVSWAPPEGVPGISGYYIYRSKTQEGTPELDKDGSLLRVPSTSPFNAGRQVRSYVDYSFNGGEPVYISDDSKGRLEYVDFEVIDGEVYHYKVVPVLVDSEGSKVEGEVISQYTSAMASSCIPSNLLTNTYETPDGLLRGKAEGDPPYWNNSTLRGLMGESLDSLLRAVQSLADRLKGVTVSASEHFNDLIESLEEWVDDLRELLTVIKNFLASLQALQFSSNVMSLTIPSESGGIVGLQERINKAGFTNELQKYLDDTDNNCSIYGGLMFVVGAPTGSSYDKLGDTSSKELEKIKKAGKFELAKAQFSAQQQGLSDRVGGERQENGYAKEIMGFLSGLLGGS